MSSEFLSSYISNAEYDLKRSIPKLIQRAEQDIASKVGFYFRQKGTCDFLRTGRVSVIFDCLHRSAGSHLYFLQKADDVHKQTSASDSFFDAIICGLWDCAKLIAENSRQSFNSDCEYEDDYLYFHFLMAYFFGDNIKASDVGTKILADYERVLNGQHDDRFLLCKTFLEKDEKGFLEVFEHFLEARSESIDRMIEREAIGEDEWSWSKYVSHEGLALLKLAERLQFKLGSGYSQVPEVLRRHPNLSFNPNLWMQMNFVES